MTIAGAGLAAALLVGAGAAGWQARSTHAVPANSKLGSYFRDAGGQVATMVPCGLNRSGPGMSDAAFARAQRSWPTQFTVKKDHDGHLQIQFVNPQTKERRDLPTTQLASGVVRATEGDCVVVAAPALSTTDGALFFSTSGRPPAPGNGIAADDGSLAAVDVDQIPADMPASFRSEVMASAMLVHGSDGTWADPAGHVATTMKFGEFDVTFSQSLKVWFSMPVSPTLFDDGASGRIQPSGITGSIPVDDSAGMLKSVRLWLVPNDASGVTVSCTPASSWSDQISRSVPGTAYRLVFVTSQTFSRSTTSGPTCSSISWTDSAGKHRSLADGSTEVTSP